jgi:hypothetical protein
LTSSEVWTLSKKRLETASIEEREYFLKLQEYVKAGNTGKIKGLSLMVAGDTGYSESVIARVMTGEVYNPRIIQAAFYEILDYLDKNGSAIGPKILQDTERLRARYGMWRKNWESLQPLGGRLQTSANKAIPVWPEDRDKVVRRSPLGRDH